MNSVKSRLIAIAAMVLLSIISLWPRTVIERVQRDGVFVDTTFKRIPLKRGLDLAGGIHLRLEVDDSQQQVADVSDALDRALRVVRNRIDELGVAEPRVQKIGSDRIIVELPGIDDPKRAEDVVKRAAFLRFQITDESNALDRAIPRLDGIVKEKGLRAVGITATGDEHFSVGMDLKELPRGIRELGVLRELLQKRPTITQLRLISELQRMKSVGMIFLRLPPQFCCYRNGNDMRFAAPCCSGTKKGPRGH